jgi:uncharacterized protein (DUF1015 family)
VTDKRRGLSLAAFRALRPTADGADLGRLLCPPYDVIGEAERLRLLEADARNVVGLILPRTRDGSDPYLAAAASLRELTEAGVFAVDDVPALYVYEMRTADGSVTRGLLGAVELRDAADGAILPHENTMAGPVADRLALMTATQANLEPIYLVYDGGGAASEAVRGVDRDTPLATATTPDGTSHRLWAITDRDVLHAIDVDLDRRRALIADGHHRYATYRQLQAELHSRRGAGPWDRGLTLLVDSSSYGPQVHAIHRVIAGLSLADASALAAATFQVAPAASLAEALASLDAVEGFAAVLTDGTRSAVISGAARDLVAASRAADEPAALAELDVTVLHRVLVAKVWNLPDTEDVVGYAHGVDDAIDAARELDGIAVLLRPTPVAAVAAVAAAGARMPRKSTLFTPKPASGLVLRRFADQP